MTPPKSHNVARIAAMARHRRRAGGTRREARTLCRHERSVARSGLVAGIGWEVVPTAGSRCDTAAGDDADRDGPPDGAAGGPAAGEPAPSRPAREERWHRPRTGDRG